MAHNRLRIENRAHLISALQEILSKKPAKKWLSKFRESEVPAGPIYAVDEALDSPQARARRVIVELEHPAIGRARSIANPIPMSANPVAYHRAPPTLGEHTDAILGELGMAREEIQRLHDKGVV